MNSESGGLPLTIEDLYVCAKVDDYEKFRIYYKSREGLTIPLRLVETDMYNERIILWERFKNDKEVKIDEKRFTLAYEQGNWWAVRDGDITLWKEETICTLNYLNEKCESQAEKIRKFENQLAFAEHLIEDLGSDDMKRRWDEYG